MTRYHYVCIMAFFICIYALTLGTGFASSDAQVMYATGRALVFDGTLALPEDYGLPQIGRAPDGRYLSQYDPGLPLLSAPVIAVSDALARWQLWDRYAFGAYSVRWLSIVGAAAGLTALYALAWGLYQEKQAALWVTLAAGLCSPVWVYARLYFAEGLLAGLLTLAFWGGMRRQWGWAGLALGLAILTRAAMLIYLVPLAWLLWRTDTRPSKPFLLDGLRFLAFPALAIVGLCLHNLWRSGHPFTFGYGGQAFETPVYEGVAGLLISPGKSVFLYAPPLLLSLFGWPRLRRLAPALAESLLIAAGVALLFYGSWWAWHGGWCWGPRLLVPLIPVWLLPFGAVLVHEGATTPDPISAAKSGVVLKQGADGIHAVPTSGAIIFICRDAMYRVRLNLKKQSNLVSERSGSTLHGVTDRVSASPSGSRAPLFTLAAGLMLLGVLINAAGVLTDVNPYYAAHTRGDVTNYAMIHYSGSPIWGAIESVMAGRFIPLGTLQLAHMGWTPPAALLFPALLILFGLMCGVRLSQDE